MATTVVTSGIKVNGAVSGNRTTSGTLYTAPATGYAIINLQVSRGNGDTASVSIGGRTVWDSASTVAAVAPGVTPFAGGSPTISGCLTMYVGPSQSVTCSAISGSGTVSISVSGVEFINT